MKLSKESCRSRHQIRISRLAFLPRLTLPRNNRKGEFCSQPVISGFWPPHWVIEFQIRRSIKSSSLSLSSNAILIAVAGDGCLLGAGMLGTVCLVKWRIWGSCIISEVVQLRSGTLCRLFYQLLTCREVLCVCWLCSFFFCFCMEGEKGAVYFHLVSPIPES